MIITNLTNCRAKHEIKQKLRLFLISDKQKRKIQKSINVHYVSVYVCVNRNLFEEVFKTKLISTHDTRTLAQKFLGSEIKLFTTPTINL